MAMSCASISQSVGFLVTASATVRPTACARKGDNGSAGCGRDTETSTNRDDQRDTPIADLEQWVSALNDGCHCGSDWLDIRMAPLEPSRLANRQRRQGWVPAGIPAVGSQEPTGEDGVRLAVRIATALVVDFTGDVAVSNDQCRCMAPRYSWR